MSMRLRTVEQKNKVASIKNRPQKYTSSYQKVGPRIQEPNENFVPKTLFDFLMKYT